MVDMNVLLSVCSMELCLIYGNATTTLTPAESSPVTTTGVQTATDSSTARGLPATTTSATQTTESQRYGTSIQTDKTTSTFASSTVRPSSQVPTAPATQSPSTAPPTPSSRVTGQFGSSDTVPAATSTEPAFIITTIATDKMLTHTSISQTLERDVTTPITTPATSSDTETMQPSSRTTSSPGSTLPRTESPAVGCQTRPCRNGGTCVQNKAVMAQYVCSCPAGFTGEQCEAPINEQADLLLEQFCRWAKGTDIAGFCYVLQDAAVSPKMAARCSRKGGSLEQFASPELLKDIMDARNLPPPFSVGVAYEVLKYLRGGSYPDPNIYPRETLARLEELPPEVFQGSGCAVLHQAASSYSINGEDCEAAQKYVCRFGQPPKTWVPKELEYFDCKKTKCWANGTKRCGAKGATCICKAGWEGEQCEEKIRYCQIDPCFFGECIEHETSFECRCIHGFKGILCDVPFTFSMEPAQIYNSVAHGIGCTWVLVSSGFTIILYLRMYDGTPEGTLKRHSLHALFLEHLLIMLFRTPLTFTLSTEVCNSIAVTIFYFRLCHSTLSFFQTLHMYTIMTGVSFGEWLLEGGYRLFLMIGWGLPGLISMLVARMHGPEFSTPFSCMIDWEGAVTRWFMALFFIAGFSVVNCEAAGMHSHLRARRARRAGRVTNPLQLEVATIGRAGSFFVVVLAPLSYWLITVAMYTGGPKWFTAALATNILLGIAIVVGYDISNPYVYAKMKEIWIQVKAGITEKKEIAVAANASGRKNGERVERAGAGLAWPSDEPGPSSRGSMTHKKAE